LYLLARTYDPIVLNQWRVLETVSDAAKAQEFYGLSGMSQLRGQNGIPESR
jgi:hypothetical protein